MRCQKYVIAFVLVLGCNWNTETTQPISSEEYVVYKRIIEMCSDSGRVNAFFLKDTTLALDPTPPKEGVFDIGGPPGSHVPQSWARMKSEWDGFDIESFKTEMKRINTIRQTILLDSIHSRTSINRLYWRRMNKALWDSLDNLGKVGLLWVSRVAFNREHTQALIYTDFVCSHVCGEGKWIWLTKQGQEWVVHDSLVLWRS
jgi:hypothetical protein